MRQYCYVSASVLFLCSLALAATAPGTVSVEGKQIELEDYAAGVVAGEAASFRSPEALKAMAVAARTFAVRFRGRHKAEGYDFCSRTHCQNYWPDAVSARSRAAVEDTAGELLWYEGRPAASYYSQNCGGTTAAAREAWPDLGAPYLRQQSDPYCTRLEWQSRVEGREIVAALRAAGLNPPQRLDRIDIVSRTPSGRAASLRLSGFVLAASSLRFALGQSLGWNTLRSDRYEVRPSGTAFIFHGQGSGHGVGLCQQGADAMGSGGKSYREILAFYYPGASVGLTAQGLRWSMMQGERAELWTTRPDRDRPLLGTAERIIRDIEQQTGLKLTERPRLRVFPSVATFRDATGEPGWVAASARGRVIRLQPPELLADRGGAASILRHELLHLAVESHAKPNLPLWFREGLVEFLASPEHHAAASMPRERIEAAIRQTSDPALARRGYAAAYAEVASAVKRFGVPAVTGWVTRGLPPELSQTSNTQAVTKSK